MGVSVANMGVSVANMGVSVANMGVSVANMGVCRQGWIGKETKKQAKCCVEWKKNRP